MTKALNIFCGIAYLIIVIFAVILVVDFPKWTVDDAYILIRYASNWAQHSELTWNIGENPVEGYTGVILVLIIGLGIKANIEPVLMSQGVGVVSFATAGIFMYLLLKKTNVTRFLRCFTVVLYATVPEFYLHSLGGLETMLFTAAILSTLYFLLVSLKGVTAHRVGYEIALMTSFLFVSLVRPEGVLLAIACLGSLFFIRMRTVSGLAGTMWRASFIYFIPGLSYFFWRWNYYGRFLPNTYYAKKYNGAFIQGDPSIYNRSINHDSVLHFKNFLEANMTSLVVAIVIACLVLIVTAKHHEIRWWKDLGPGLRPAFWSALVFVCLIIGQYCRSVLLMNYSYRFFIPLLPLFLIGTVFVLSRMFRVLREYMWNNPTFKWVMYLVVGACIYVQISKNMARITPQMKYAANYMKLMNDEHIKVGRYIKNNIPPSEWLISYIDAGHIPYFSGLKTVDFGKLNDEVLARKGSEKRAVNYFFSFNPGVAVFTSKRWDKLVPFSREMRKEALEIIHDDRFANYVLVKKYRSDARQNYFQFVYIRKDLV